MNLINKFFSYSKSTLVKSTGIYLISKVINKSIPFFMLPVMTSYLSKTDYGIITMVTTLFAFVAPFVNLSLDSAIVRRFYYKGEETSKYIGNCLFLSFLACIAITFLFICVGRPLGRVLEIPWSIVLLAPTYCFLGLFNSANLAFWQVNQKPIPYGILSIAATLIELVIAITLIVGCGFDWHGRFISIFSTAIIFACVSMFILSRERMVSFKIDKQLMSHALRFGSGLIPHAIGATLMTMVNRICLTKMVSIEETGLYSVSMQFASILSFITLSFNNAFVPWLYTKLSLHSNIENRKVVRFTYLYIAALFIIALLLYGIILLIFPYFVNHTFHDALKYVPWLLLGAVFQGCYFMVTNYITYTEKTYLLAGTTIAVGILSIILNYVLISKFGAIGTAISYAISFFLYFIIVWVISAKVYPMPWFILTKKK